MSDLRDLYQEVILDHHKHPRNCRRMEKATCSVEGFNPLCGDKCTVFVRLDADGRIADISFEGAGCAISMASASMMTQALKGKTVEEADALFRGFQDMVTGKMPETDAPERLGKLAVFAGVREYPARVKCATLAWHAAHSAIHGEQKTVTTEE